MPRNNLKKLRTDTRISLNKLEQYVNISNSNLSLIENDRRPLRLKHIIELSAFFNVTADYLLGKSDTGIIVYNEAGDEFVLNENEYHDLIGKIKTTIVDLKVTTDRIILDMDQDSYIAKTQFRVYREFSERLNEFDLTPILTNKLNNLIKRMTSKELEKTIKFVEEYMLDRN